MVKLKTLIWDDIQHEAEKMKDLLEPIIVAHKWDMDVEIRHEKYTDFQKYLSKTHQSYHLLILDCMDKDRGNVAQFALRMLKQVDSDLKVIVTTGYSPDGFESLPDIYGKHKCRAVLKSKFHSDKDPERMELIIAEILNLKADYSGKTGKIELKIDLKEKVNLAYLVELIGGEQSVRKLILRLQDDLGYNIDTNLFILRELSQGLSGAIVFNLVIQDSNRNSTFRFIKLSKNEYSARIELLKASKEYIEIPSNYILTYINNEPISFNGYYIILALLVDRSISLRKKIFKDSNGNLSIKLVEELFTKCLSELYHRRRCVNKNEQIVHSILKIFDTRRLSFLDASNKELEIVTDTKIQIVSQIKELQKEMSIDSIFYRKDNLKNILVHGDLHSNNVIVSKDDRIFIIDPASMGNDHWSRDICMFIVDIFAYGIDTETKEYFGIAKIKKWVKMGIKIINNTEIENGGRNKGIVASINWLIKKENLRHIFKDFFELWEFQMSLGVEFLRASYKNDTLPAGKRAACLLIGIEAINIAKKTYEKSLGDKS